MIRRSIQRALAGLGYVVMKTATYERFVSMSARATALEQELAALRNAATPIPLVTPAASAVSPQDHMPAQTQPARKIAFLHIGKTAGSSLNQLLKDTLSDLPCIHVGPWEYDELSTEKLDPYGLILGHFSYHHILKCRTRPFLLTFFRDPVDRVVSNYYFLRSWDGYVNDTNRIPVEAGRSLTLREFISDPRPQVQRIVRNQQTYSLGADWRDVRVAADYDAVLAKAMSALDRFSFVGTTDAYERGVTLLFRMLGVEVPAATKRLNVTPDRPALTDVSREDIETIGSLNALDRQLFEEAQRRFLALERNWNERPSS